MILFIVVLKLVTTPYCAERNKHKQIEISRLGFCWTTASFFRKLDGFEPSFITICSNYFDHLYCLQLRVFKIKMQLVILIPQEGTFYLSILTAPLLGRNLYYFGFLV